MRGFVLEAVYEGYLMHYGEPRAFSGMDADLRLLAGDALYALGLSRLAETGDLEAVARAVRPHLGLRAGSGGGRGRRTRRLSGATSSDRLRAPLVRSVTKLAFRLAERDNP